MLILPTPTYVSRRPLVTVCGSFNRHLREVQYLIEELSDEGAVVLSPQKAIPWCEIGGGFLLLEGDKANAGLLHMDDPIKHIENEHVACILRSDFIFVAGRDGYLGNSTAFEVGSTIARNIPIYSLASPRVVRIGHYVTVVPSVKIAVLNHTTHYIGPR